MAKLGDRIKVTSEHIEIKKYYGMEGVVKGFRDGLYMRTVVKMDNGEMLELYDDEYKIIK
jgi:hypothetical protein